MTFLYHVLKIVGWVLKTPGELLFNFAVKKLTVSVIPAVAAKAATLVTIPTATPSA